MHVNNASHQEESQLVHCLAREMCPLRQICAAPCPPGGSPLLPMVATLDPAEELWADARFEQRVYVIQSGVFACIPNAADNLGTRAAALYGRGDSFGLAELYSGRDIADMYHMRALTQAVVRHVFSITRYGPAEDRRQDSDAPRSHRPARPPQRRKV